MMAGKVSLSAVLLVLLGYAEAGILDHYTVHADQRPSGRPDRRMNRIESAEVCGDICERFSSIRCTMFAFREGGRAGGKCFMYNDKRTKSFRLDLEEFIDSIGFTTFEFYEDGFGGPPETTTAPKYAKEECIEDSDPLGLKYTGTQSKTNRGRTCQKWTRDRPHRRAHKPKNPKKHRNYCRNPDKDHGGLWCYTTDKRVRWEYCTVPQCSVGRPSTKPPSRSSPATMPPSRSSPATMPPSRSSPATTPPSRSSPATTPPSRSSPATTPTSRSSPATTPPSRSSPVSTGEPVPETCYVCNGQDYRGYMNRTSSGKTCQRWDSSVPHVHTNHPSMKPESHLEGNLCRNPDGDLKPWCYTTDPNTRWEYCGGKSCTNADGSVLIPHAQYTTECVVGSGTNYRGIVAITKLGKRCVPWAVEGPHKHNKRPGNYPCSGLDSNYCRNPTANFEDGPWCYTNDPATRWEVCDIPKCGPDGRPIPTTTTAVVSTRSIAVTPTTTPGTCGSQVIQPSFTMQAFNIEDSKVVRSDRRKRSTNTQQQERILGGDIAIHGSWPWSVSLRYHDVHFCGGTLIKRSWVLTASHCLDDGSTPLHMSVKVGHHIGSEPQMQMRKVLLYILHESYSKERVKNDIALIQVEAPFDITDYVRLACLPQPEYIVPADSYCMITGWGNTYDPKYRNQLKQAVVPVHSYKNCNRYMGSHMRDQTQMCAGYSGKGHDSCRGDSGGPLSCLNNERWTVQGITSWGSGCENKKGNFGSYTRVSKYITWINNHIAKNE